jgi:site-specific recombinase XerD
MLTLRDQLATIGPRMPAVLASIEAAPLDDADRIDEVIEFLGYLRTVRGLALMTMENYGRAVVAWLLWLQGENTHPDDITIAGYERWMRHLAIERSLAAQTRANLLAAVRHWYQWRVGRGDIPANPLQAARGPKIPQHVARNYSTDEMQRLFRAARQTEWPERNRALLAIALATGARRGELAAMTLGDLTLQAKIGSLLLHGKGAKERIVSFEGPAVVALREWLAHRDQLDSILDTDAVWLGRPSRDIGQRAALKCRGLDQIISRIGKLAGIADAGWHRIRASFATDLFDQGIPIEVIQELMGHANVETTRRYITISKRYRRSRMATTRLDEVMNGAQAAAAPLWAREQLKGRVGHG